MSELHGVIEQWVKWICTEWKSGKLLNQAQDSYYWKNRVAYGVKFPIALIANSLRETESIVECGAGNTIDEMKDLIWRLYRKSRFSYLAEEIMPNDLDTLSEVTRLLDLDEVTDDANHLLDEIWFERFPPVFLASSREDVEKFKDLMQCGSKYWHPDVLANYYLICLDNPRLLRKGSVLDLIENVRPDCYWYIPSTYTLFKYNHIRWRLGRPMQNRSIYERYLSVDRLREVQKSVNCPKLTLLLGSCFDCNTKHDEFVKNFEEIECDDPGIYPTFGYQIYRSRHVAVALALQAASSFVGLRSVAADWNSN